MVLQVPRSQALLDTRLPRDEPVHRRVEFVLVDRADAEHRAEGGDGALGGQGAGRGQLRLRVDDAGGDQGEGEVTPARGLSRNQGVESELLEGANHGGDVAVRQVFNVNYFGVGKSS